MAFTPPNFNLTCNVWRFPDFPPGVPTLQPACQFYLATRVDFDVKPGDARTYQPSIQIRLPIGTDVRVGDLIEAAAGDGWFYNVRFVERVHRGFVNEYFVAYVEQVGGHPDAAIAGGILLGGSAIIISGAAIVERGGIELGGYAWIGPAPGEVSRGGIALGGDALTSNHDGPIERGGISFGGEAFIYRHVGPIAHAVVALGGDVLTSSHVGPIARGGVMLGGDAFTSPHLGPIERGGILFGGRALLNPPDFISSEGGIEFGGEVVISHGPGTDCDHATHGTLGVQIAQVWPVFPDDYWFVWDGLTPGSSYHVSLDSFSGSIGLISIYKGDCSGLSFVGFLASLGPFCVDVTADSTGRIVAKMAGDLMSTGTARFTCDAGTC